jgi:hypothetical protein
MKAIHYFLLFVIAGSFASCNKDGSVEFTDTPIITTYLSPGNPVSVNIARQIPFSSNAVNSSDNINALAVQVNYNNVWYTLMPIGNGQYVDSALKVQPGGTYQLSFTFNSKPVSALTSIPYKPTGYTESASAITLEQIDSAHSIPTLPTPPPIQLNWINTDGSYYIVVVQNIETVLSPIRNYGTFNTVPHIFRESPTTSNTIQIEPREFQYFGRHRMILYHCWPDYAALYNRTSNSSQDLTNPSTNITNGYGIFTGLNADTLMVDVLKY